MKWLRRLLGIPPAPTKTFDHSEFFSPETREWIESNRRRTTHSGPTSSQESDAVARRRREEADRRRRDDDDFAVASYAPAILDHTPSKSYSSSGHDSRDHTPAHSHTYHDTTSYSDAGSCGSDGGGGGGCD